MANVVTHVILTIVIIDIFRDYFLRRKFPTWLVLVGGIAGLAPDLDIPFTWIYNWLTATTINFHGTFTHSIILPIIFLLIGLFLRYRKVKKNFRIFFYVIAFGWFMHLLLDCLFGGYSSLLFPFYTGNICPQWNISQYAPAIDAIILILWLVHEEIHHKIRDYI